MRYVLEVEIKFGFKLAYSQYLNSLNFEGSIRLKNGILGLDLDLRGCQALIAAGTRYKKILL